VDSFACPASFSWHTSKNVSRDLFPKSTKFSADDYVVLVAHPTPFWKFLEPFLCLIRMSRNYTLDADTYPTSLHDDGTEMDLLAFIQVADPTKVKVGERERVEEEARLLDSTVGRVVLLLSVALACADSELEASVDRLFDEGGSADQGDFAIGGGQEIETEIVMGIRFVADENVGDHETSSGAAAGDKSPSILKELLASSMLNVEVGVTTMATLPVITSLVYATPEHESGVPADSIIGLNLRTIGASERFVISSDSSHHSSINASRAEADSVIKSDVVPLVMTEAVITTNVASIPSAPAPETGTKLISPVHASMFHDSDSTGTWNVSNDSLLDDHDVSQTARQDCLNVEVRIRTKHCLSGRRRLESECEKQVDLPKAIDAEVESLKAQLLLKETEAAEAAHLRAQVSAAEAMEKIHTNEIDALKQRNVALENEKESLDGKVAELQSSVSAKDLELKDLNASVSSLRSQKDGLVDQV
ncbi:hypothetical protein Tco_1423029, partial [Tanacetum coccineum]